MEIFKITISPLSLYDKKLLTKILDIELHKAFLYFTNKALKTMRWKAGEIILTLNNLIEADTYAKPKSRDTLEHWPLEIPVPVHITEFFPDSQRGNENKELCQQYRAPDVPAHI